MHILTLGLLIPMLSTALLVVAVFSRDWSRLTTHTTLWSEVLIDDYWGLWRWSTVMTSSSSTVRLSFDYDWCSRDDTVDQCHLLVLARVLAVATALLEAGAVLGALVVECRTARRSGFSAEYVCVGLSTAHLVCGILMLVIWSAVQDELRAQDLTNSSSKIHFGFSWYFFLISAASTLLTDWCIIKQLARHSAYARISPPGAKSGAAHNVDYRNTVR